MRHTIVIACLFVLCACDSSTPSADPGPGDVQRIALDVRTPTTDVQRYEATYVEGTTEPEVFRLTDSLNLEPETVDVRLEIETSTVDLVSSANWPSNSRIVYGIDGGLTGVVDVRDGTPPVIDRDAEASEPNATSRAALAAKTSPAVMPVIIIESATARARGEVVLDWGVFPEGMGRVRPGDADSLWFRLEMPARLMP